MTTRNLSRRLERLEARTPSVGQPLSVLINFVGGDGCVTSALLLEPDKPPTRIPANAAPSAAQQRLTARR